MPLRQHQPVGREILRVLRVEAHLPVHEHADDVGQGEGGGRVPAAGGAGHLHRQLAELCGLVVDGVGVAHERAPSGVADTSLSHVSRPRRRFSSRRGRRGDTG